MKTRIWKPISTFPTERSGQVKQGLDVELMDNSGKLLEKTKIDFLSPEVDSTLQGILVKAPVHSAPELLRNGANGKGAGHLEHEADGCDSGAGGHAPGRADLRLCGAAAERAPFAHQTPVTLGDTVGNSYSISSGLNAGDKVIVSSTQFLVNGMPVMPLPGA